MQLRKIQLVSNSLLNWLLQGKDNSFNLPNYTKNMICQNIVESKSLYCDYKHKKVENVSLEDFSLHHYTDHEEIIEIAKYLKDKKDLFSYFLIHGSYSDLKIVPGWSDFDSIAIIKKNILAQPSKRQELLNTCIELDKIMRKVDVHQHHGIQYMLEEELNSYPDLYLPKNIINNTKCVLGNQHLKIISVDSKSYEINRLIGIYSLLKESAQTGVLLHHKKNEVYLEENYKNIKTMYQLKYFLCVIMLLPTLWLNNQGVYCKKKDSFELIKRHFSNKELELLTCASEIRASWSQEINLDLNLNVIPVWIRNILGSDYLARGGKLAKIFERKNI